MVERCQSGTAQATRVLFHRANAYHRVASPGKMSREELRKRIEPDGQLKRDFDFLIEKTGLLPQQLLTGLNVDCNMMKADEQRILSINKKEMWPISEDDLRRTVKNIRRLARQIEATDKTDFSPLRTNKIGDNFVGLPKILRLRD